MNRTSLLRGYRINEERLIDNSRKLEIYMIKLDLCLHNVIVYLY